MKKLTVFLLALFLSLLCAAALADVSIDRYFPDSAFRKYVKEAFDKDGDRMLSDREIANATRVNCNKLGIQSLQGIEYLTEATYLDCGDNPLQSIDIRSNKKLTVLTCCYTDLTGLDLSGNRELKEINCFNTKISALDVSMCGKLEELFCLDSGMVSLKLGSLPNLKTLVCEANQLIRLDLSGVTGLNRLACGNNKLSSLDVTGLGALKDLSCNLGSLDVSQNKALLNLNCHSNRLSSLKLDANKKLYALACCANKLKKVEIGKCPVLVKLVTGSDAVSEGNTWVWGNKTYRNKVSLWVDKTTAVDYGKGELSGLVEKITLNKTEVTLTRTAKKPNPTVTLKATVKPDSAVRKTVEWKSSDPKVAKVDPKTGKVTALKAGTAKITCRATDGSKVKAVCTVTVKNRLVRSITLNKKKATLKTGKSLTLKIKKIAPADAVKLDVKWKSSNKKVAAVDKNGRVTAKKPGTCEITCTAKDGSKVYVVCKITVK